MLNLLLVSEPVTVGLHFLRPEAHTWIFIAASVAIISLAGWLGRATEHLAGDGECNWLEGVQLLAVYIILGIVFYFLPEHTPADAAPAH